MQVAGTGLEVLAALAVTSPQLILMDVQMPEMDGLEATRKIRENPEWDDIPIVALTAHALAEERDRCLASGMDGYLSKPFRPEHLRDEVRRRVEGHDTRPVS